MRHISMAPRGCWGELIHAGGIKSINMLGYKRSVIIRRATQGEDSFPMRAVYGSLHAR